VTLLIDGKKSYEDVAAELNRLEMYTRSGRPWTANNLYQRMHSETFDGRTTYRKTNRGHREKARKLHEDRTPVHGDPVHISVPRILTPDRTGELKVTLKERSIGEPRKPARIYTLSGHIVSDCGLAYVGGGRTGQRAYRCQGNSSTKSGCGCTNLDAIETEDAVWSVVAQLLTNEVILSALAEGEFTSLPGDRDKYLERQQRLGTSIEKQRKLIEDAVPEYIKAGMEPAVATAATRRLPEEVESWEKQLGEVQHWLSQYEQMQDRANAIMSLVHSPQEPTVNLDAVGKARISDTLRIVVFPAKGRFVKRSGAPCAVTAWHHATGTRVPPDLHRPVPRDSTLLDDQTGPAAGPERDVAPTSPWSGVVRNRTLGPPRDYPPAAGSLVPQRRLMEHLTSDGQGTAAYRHPTIPPLHVVSEVLSRGLPHASLPN
jgi:hypothetical protein